MNRPEGISPKTYAEAPEDIRNAVEQLIRDYGRDPALLAGAIVSATSRIIQSSVEAERLRCIGVALSFIQYGGDTHHGITENPRADVREVAAAIRKGA